MQLMLVIYKIVIFKKQYSNKKATNINFNKNSNKISSYIPNKLSKCYDQG